MAGQDLIEALQSAYNSPRVREHWVNQMVCIALSIIKTIEAIKHNKEAFLIFRRNVCEFVVNLLEKARMTERSIFTDSKIEALRINLSEIKGQVRRRVQRQGLVRRVLHYHSNRKTIRECYNCLRNCYDILEFQYTKETWEQVNVLTQQVMGLPNHQKQGGPAQVSSAPSSPPDSVFDLSSPSPELERGAISEERINDSISNQTTGPTNARSLRIPGNLITAHRRASGGTSVNYARFSGDAVTNSMGTVVNISGSGNRLHISLRS